ncbi:hypothetical protein Bhyg_07859 [Pseudolycoriella hygida]|uniref:Uncharacterized protein n=1 Tax=Pseudolycoriella hygida TaxID=35572 RepID=A0A9Q0N3G9_9DIPT|nr:hypothetical protein Bhyg_07859 [Pseudolycoriella hygida]
MHWGLTRICPLFDQTNLYLWLCLSDLAANNNSWLALVNCSFSNGGPHALEFQLQLIDRDMKLSVFYLEQIECRLKLSGLPATNAQNLTVPGTPHTSGEKECKKTAQNDQLTRFINQQLSETKSVYPFLCSLTANALTRSVSDLQVKSQFVHSLSSTSNKLGDAVHEFCKSNETEIKQPLECFIAVLRKCCVYQGCFIEINLVNNITFDSDDKRPTKKCPDLKEKKAKMSLQEIHVKFIEIIERKQKTDSYFIHKRLVHQSEKND